MDALILNSYFGWSPVAQCACSALTFSTKRTGFNVGFYIVKSMPVRQCAKFSTQKTFLKIEKVAHWRTGLRIYWFLLSEVQCANSKKQAHCKRTALPTLALNGGLI